MRMYVCARSRYGYGAAPLAYEYWLIEERMCMLTYPEDVNQIWISKVSGCFHSWMKKFCVIKL